MSKLCALLVLWSSLFFWGGPVWAAATCSPYKDQVFINEVNVGTSRSTSTSNKVELFNSGNVPQSVWQTWTLKVSYRKSSSTTISNKGPYTLSSGFTANGSFIYNSTKAIYLRNRNGYYVDIALVDASGNFIDYVALENGVQTVPSCMSKPVLNTTPNDDITKGYAARIPDAGTWPANMAGTYSTIGYTNVCTVGSSPDLGISNTFLPVSAMVKTTTVTYSVTVSNKSCTASASNVAAVMGNISTSNFSSLSTSVTSGSASLQAAGLNWTLGTLAAGAVATLTVTGVPVNLGQLTSIASITGPPSGLVNTADDSDSADLTVKDFNYVGFDLASDQLLEGTDLTYSATISSDSIPGAKVVIAYTVSGTATSLDTNLPVSGTVTIDPASSDPNSASIDFTITNDNQFEPTKTIILTITSVTSTDGNVKLDSASKTLTLTLDDDDSGKVVDYAMDEASWTGSTGEVGDRSGNGRNGTGKNGATTVPGKLCYGGYFNGSSYMQGPSTDLGLTSGLTVMAWVKWGVVPGSVPGNASIVNNNSSSAADTGQFWLQHNATNSSYEFAVKTSAARYVLASSTPPTNGVWRHVAGTWDAATNSLKIYVDGALQSVMLTTGTGLASYASSYGLNVGRWAYGTGRYFNGSIDEVKVLNYALQATDIATGYANESAGNNWDGTARTCPNYAPGGLNAFDSATPSGAIVGFIKTKVAGTAFAVDVVALNATKTAVDTAFSQNVRVELLGNTSASVAVDATNCPVTSTVLQTGTTTMALGRATASLTAEPNVWRNARVRISFPATGTASVTSCSNDNFAIRPASLTAIARDTTWTTPGSARTLNAGTVSGTPVHKAGQPFTLAVTAYNANSALTGNYDGSPSPGSVVCTLPASGCVGGLFSTGTFTGAAGVSTSNTASYSEVGAVSLQLQDSNFASVDLLDGSSTAELTAYAPAITVGRFVPDHFTVTPGVITQGCSAFGKTAFTYLGQDGLQTQQTLTAQNAANSTVQNYVGTLARLDLSAYASYGFTATGMPAGAALSSASTAPTGIWSAGIALNTLAKHKVSKPVNPSTESTVAISAAPVDLDGVTVTAPVVVANNQKYRHGRLKLMNSYGAPTTDIVPQLLAQYWTSFGYVTNGDDSCSGLPLNALGFRNYSADLSASELGSGNLTSASWTLASGASSIRLRKPSGGDGKFRGSVDLFANLGNDASCDNGATVAATGLAHLQDSWPWNNLVCRNPVGRITFGSGKQKFLFRREMF